MSHFSKSSNLCKQITHLNQYNHVLQITPPSPIRKQDLYPKATIKETEQQHSDIIETRIPISQTHHSLRIDPHTSSLQVAPLREYGHPQRIPSFYSASTSPNDIAYFIYSPLKVPQQITPQLHLQHSSRIAPHPSVLFPQRIPPYSENERINLHPSIAPY